MLFQFPRQLFPAALLLIGLASALSSTAATPAPAGVSSSGGTRILKWKDGRKAAFMLAFDDSYPSHVNTVIPELTKRKMVGNFYVVPGTPLWTEPGRNALWLEAAKNPYVALQNHTFTHKGVNSAEELDRELQKCNEAIYAITPHLKKPRLIGFGQPGGVPWKVTGPQMKEALAKYHLVNRPWFAGPPLTMKTLPEVLATVTTALEKGEMGHVDFHGVGGDWHVTSIEWFQALLDALESHRDRLWIAELTEIHKYGSERKSATVEEVQSDEAKVRVKLTCPLDPAWYDYPLTLRSKVPASWTECTVTQGSNRKRVTPVNGEVTYDAMPGTEEIVIAP